MVLGMIRRAVQLLGVLWVLAAGHAQAELRLFLTGKDAQELRELQSLLQQSLGSGVTFVEGGPEDRADLIVSVGAEGLQALRDRRPPVLLLAPSPSDAVLGKTDSAIYWSPSLSAQLALTRYLLPATNRIGMLVSNDPDDQSWIRSFRQYAATQSVDVRIMEADPARLARQVAELATTCDVLLAQPDLRLYNRDSIRLVLLAAYRQNRVLIGPGPAFVRAGALASLYAPPARIAEAVAQAVRAFERNGRLPPPARLKHFSVSLNAQVARSLGLTVPAAAELERMLPFEELPTWP